MNLQLSFDSRSFSRDLNQLRVLLKKDGATIVKDEGRLFVRDAMKLTPPCGRHAITESWADQRKMGERRVKIEIRRLFPILSEIHVIRRPLHMRAYKWVKKYIREKNKQALHKILEDFGIPVPVILDTATKMAHTGARDAKGRVRKEVHHPVLDGRSVEKLIKSELSQVGKGKAGWMNAARQLRLVVPNWISRHNSPGIWNDRTINTYFPFIEVGNLVDYANDAGARLEIVKAAMQNRRRSIRIRIEKLIAYYARR